MCASRRPFLPLSASLVPLFFFIPLLLRPAQLVLVIGDFHGASGRRSPARACEPPPVRHCLLSFLPDSSGSPCGVPCG